MRFVNRRIRTLACGGDLVDQFWARPMFDPIAFFITWTVYGTWLPGDGRGWHRHQSGHVRPQPLLADWNRRRLTQPVVLLDDTMQTVVEVACKEHCDHRDWNLWAVSARTNHVHVLVSAAFRSPNQVRDQLKANSTRRLRIHDARFEDRPVWTRGGYVAIIETEEGLATTEEYISLAQDRMGHQSP